MDLIIVRHAIAEERDSERWPGDALRPLTAQGIKKFRSVAAGLAAVAPRPGRLFSSPWARAWQTAGVLSAEAGWPEPERMAELTADAAPAQTLEALSRVNAKTIALVGHEPHVSGLLSLLLHGDTQGDRYLFKKGGAALVAFGEAAPSPSGGELQWLLQPGMARALA